MACAQSVKFVNTNNTIVKDITSLNSKFFHMALLGCHNFKGSGITITAPATSPNTDGIHLEGNSGVTIASSKIRTGDDCVSIGHGNSFVTISGITCGPGHGIRSGICISTNASQPYIFSYAVITVSEAWGGTRTKRMYRTSW